MNHIRGKNMKHSIKLFSMLSGIFAGFMGFSAYAKLKCTPFPKTINDYSFTERIDNKREGYEPYQKLKTYDVPILKMNDDGFYEEVLDRKGLDALCDVVTEDCLTVLCRIKPGHELCRIDDDEDDEDDDDNGGGHGGNHDGRHDGGKKDCTGKNTTKEGEKCVCTDKDNMTMDAKGDCSCTDISKTVTKGKCVDKNPEDPATDGIVYYLVQCRTNNTYKKGETIGVSNNGCDTTNHESVSDCFLQCNPDSGHVPLVNKKIEKLLGADTAQFCTGRLFKGLKGTTYDALMDLNTKQRKEFTNIEADEIFQALKTDIPNDPLYKIPNSTSCGTSYSNWYFIKAIQEEKEVPNPGLAADTGTRKMIVYKIIDILNLDK